MAGVEVMIPYVTRAIGVAFPVNELDGSLTVPFGLGPNHGFSPRQTALLAEGGKEFDLVFENSEGEQDEERRMDDPD